MASSQKYCTGAIGWGVKGALPSWVDITNMYDGTPNKTTFGYSNTTFSANYQEHYMRTFGFSIPTDATIDGFEVIVHAYDNYSGNTINIALSKDTTQSSQSTNSANIDATTSAQDYTVGGPTDLWGETWTFTEVNEANFGVYIGSLRRGTSSVVRVHSVEVVCYYTEGGTSDEDRIVHTLEVIKNVAGQIVHNIEAEVTAQDRIAQYLVGAKPDQSRITHWIETYKNTYSRLAHTLELIPAFFINKFAPDTDESGDTSGTWVKSTGSTFWGTVDETDEDGDILDHADYNYIGHDDIVVDTSQIIFSTQGGAGYNVAQPTWRRLAVRVSASDLDAVPGNRIGLKAVLIQGGDTYVHNTERLSLFNYATDMEWVWDEPPWEGDDWGQPSTIKFGVRITTDNGTLTADQCRLHQCYLNFLGSGDNSLVKIFYPTAFSAEAGNMDDSLGEENYRYWRSLRFSGDSTVFDSTPTTISYIKLFSHEGGVTRDFGNAALGYTMRIHVWMRLDSAGEVEVKGYSGSGFTTPQTLTQTSFTEFTFDFDDKPGGGSWGDPDDIDFGVRIHSRTASATWRIDRMYYEIIGTYDRSAIVHTIEAEKFTQDRIVHNLDFGTVGGTVDWFDSSLTKRQPITYGTSHDELASDYTMLFEFQTGYGQKIASNSVVNEGLGIPLAFKVDTSGSPDRPYTFYCWLGVTDSGYYNVWVRRYDHYTATWGDAFDAGPTESYSDTHFVPAISVDGDGYVWLFYGTHGHPVKYRKSTSPYSISAWSAQAELYPSTDAVTYQSPKTDSAGNIWLFARGYSGTVPAGTINQEYAGYYKYTLSTDSWGPWRLVVDYSIDSDRNNPSESGSVYTGGYFIDADDRIHWSISWWEGYGGGVNKGRSMSCMYSDDGENWYQFNAANPDGELIGITDSSPVRYVAHDGYSAVTRIVHRTSMSNGPWPIAHGDGLAVDVNGHPHLISNWVDKGTWDHHWGPCDMQVSSWDGTDWTTTNLTDSISGAPQLMYYRTGGAIIVDDGQAQIYVYAFCRPATADAYFGGELYRWRGSSLGEDWVGGYVTANTNFGLGGVRTVQKQYPGQPRELALCRGNNIFWHQDLNFPLVKPTGQDLRIVRHYYNNLTDAWSGTDVDRLPDRFRGLDTEISFSAGVPVPEDKENPGAFTRMYVYYGNPNHTVDALNDPDNVWVFFEGWEGMTTGSDPDTQNGWSIYGAATGEIADYYRDDLFLGEEAKWPLIFGGDKSLWLKRATGGGTSGLERTITLDSHDITIWLRETVPVTNVTSITGVEIYDSGSGDWFRFGRVWSSGTDYRAGYWASGDAERTVTATEWNQTGGELAEWYELRLTIGPEGINCWFNNIQIVTNDTHMTSATTFRLSLEGTSTNKSYYDQLTIKRHVANDATISLGAAEGDAELAQGRIVHQADMAYFRASRIGQTLELAQSSSGKLVHMIEADKTADDRIAEWLELEARAAAQLVHDIETQKAGSSRLMHWLVAEKTAWTQIVHSMVLAYRASSRLANELELEAAYLSQIAQMIVGDKHLRSRMVEMIVGDKPGQSRLMQMIQAEASIQTATVNILELDKRDRDQLAHILVAEVSLASQLAHNLELTKSGKARLAQILVGEKWVSDRIVQTLIFEASPEGRIAQILESEAHRSVRIAQALVAAKPDSGRLAHTLEQEASAQGRIVQWAEMEASAQAQIVHNLELVVAASGRMTHIAETVANRAARIVQTLDLDVAKQDSIAYTLELVQGGAAIIAQILVGDKAFRGRIVHDVIFLASGSERMVHDLGLSQNMSTNLAHSLVGDKHVRSNIVHAIVAEAQKQAQLVHQIVTDKNMTERLAYWLEVDKNVAASMVHTLDFIGSVIGFHFTDTDWSVIGMSNDAMNRISFASDTMTQIQFTNDDMVLGAVSWASESMAQITFASETMVPAS